MNTLNYKALFRMGYQRNCIALLTWFTTCIVVPIIIEIIVSIGELFKPEDQSQLNSPGQIVFFWLIFSVISLIFTLPVFILLIANHEILDSLKENTHRAFYAFISIFIFCCLEVIGIDTVIHIGILTDLDFLLYLFGPYFLIAELSYFYWARKTIFQISSHENTNQ